MIAALLSAFSLARAQEPAPPARALPEPYAAALRAANVPQTAVGTMVLPLGTDAASGPLAISLNPSLPLNPASTMKLVTTYAALQLLGPAYTWRTEAFAAGALRGDVLDGDLAFRGGGDPTLVIERMWLLVQRLRTFGIRAIHGDVLLDRSAFALAPVDPGAFDGEVLRPYNAPPDALLLNFKAVTFGFVPEPDTRRVRVVAMPPLAGLKLPRSVPALDGACGDWRARLQADFSNALAPLFRGGYPLACGERHWHVSVLDHTQYFDAAFRALWEGAGGAWTGTARRRRTGRCAARRTA